MILEKKRESFLGKQIAFEMYVFISKTTNLIRNRTHLLLNYSQLFFRNMMVLHEIIFPKHR